MVPTAASCGGSMAQGSRDGGGHHRWRLHQPGRWQFIANDITNVNGRSISAPMTDPTATNCGESIARNRCNGGGFSCRRCINPGAGIHAILLTNFSGHSISKPMNGSNGYELWRINSFRTCGDGVRILSPAAESAPALAVHRPSSLTNVNGTIYFQANDGTNGIELWRINISCMAEIVEDCVAVAVPIRALATRRRSFSQTSTGHCISAPLMDLTDTSFGGLIVRDRRNWYRTYLLGAQVHRQST